MKNYYLIINFYNIIDNCTKVSKSNPFFPCVRRMWVPALEFGLFLKSEGKWVIFWVECGLLLKYPNLKKNSDIIFYLFLVSHPNRPLELSF
jgi:hypothetical protein